MPEGPASYLVGPDTELPEGFAIRGTSRVLIAGVGNPWLRDLDFGPQFIRKISELEWPSDVAVEDASYSAHRVLHLLQEVQPERIIFVSGYPRGDAPGTVRRYVESGETATDEDVMDRLGEAAGGVIDFDHTLIVARYYKALPADTVVIEVEAGDTAFGTGFSEEVENSIEKVLEMVREEVAR
ncbi:MAG: hydrogenase maturation protease [Actinobacteria bacterium]|nr:hydrogenase maturation protease [Actinomycetota bacterium]